MLVSCTKHNSIFRNIFRFADYWVGSVFSLWWEQNQILSQSSLKYRNTVSVLPFTMITKGKELKMWDLAHFMPAEDLSTGMRIAMQNEAEHRNIVLIPKPKVCVLCRELGSYLGFWSDRLTLEKWKQTNKQTETVKCLEEQDIVCVVFCSYAECIQLCTSIFPPAVLTLKAMKAFCVPLINASWLYRLAVHELWSSFYFYLFSYRLFINFPVMSSSLGTQRGDINMQNLLFIMLGMKTVPALQFPWVVHGVS